MATSFPDPCPLLSPWLDERGFVVLQAAPKAGKTWLALGVALAVAGGGSFLGWRAGRPRTVLYVDAENGQRRMQQRITLMRGCIEGIDLEAARVNFRLCSAREYEEESGFPVIDGKRGSQSYVDAVTESGAELIILDTMAKLVALEDENAATSYRDLCATARDLQRAGSAVLLLHHLRKGGRGSDPNAGRGSGALGAAVDLVLGLDPAKHPEQPGGLAFKISAAASRDGISPGLTAWLGADGFQWRALDAVNLEAPGDAVVDDISRMIAAAKARKYANLEELAGSLGWPIKTLRNVHRKAKRNRRLQGGQLVELTQSEPVLMEDEAEADF